MNSSYRPLNKLAAYISVHKELPWSHVESQRRTASEDEGVSCDRHPRHDVVGHNAGLGRRRFVDRRDHLHQAVLHGDLDAEAAELAAGLHLYVAEAIWIRVV